MFQITSSEMKFEETGCFEAWAGIRGLGGNLVSQSFLCAALCVHSDNVLPRLHTPLVIWYFSKFSTFKIISDYKVTGVLLCSQKNLSIICHQVRGNHKNKYNGVKY